MPKELDDRTIEYLMNNNSRILKQLMSKDVKRENYKPLLTQYGDTIRVGTKFNTSGYRVYLCWDKDKTPCDLLEDWLNHECALQVAIPHFCIMGSSFDRSLETANLLARPIHNDCPF